ncbi:MAG: SDR family oxidoreductase [Rubrivivax sp.]|nr:SDR family oxidoreductase [Rubrivivax sp.]
MAFDFQGYRVAVAGGSRGIGRAIALGFARSGASVSICARGREALEATQADLERAGARAHAASCDLGDAAAVRAWVDDAAAALGGLDVLVNNASGFGMGDDEAAWSAGLNIDVMATVRASQAALPHLLRAPRDDSGRGASIINITSIAAGRPSTRAAAYAAVKSLLVNYTVSQAAAVARQGVRVNAVAPGSIEFPGGLWDERRRAGDPLYERTLRMIPAGRMGLPDEVADTALFLASRQARWVTGQTLMVDGGQLLGA